MLSMPSFGSSGQIRAYSSDSRNGLEGEFGFQSLGSLFPASPSPGRYSRSRERRAEEAMQNESKERIPETKAQNNSAPDATFFLPTPPHNDNNGKPSGETAAKPRAPTSVLNAEGKRPLVRRFYSVQGEEPTVSVDSASAIAPRVRRIRGPAKAPHTAAKPRGPIATQADRKTPNPFATTTHKSSNTDETVPQVESNAKAWGLSQEDQDTVDSTAKPSVPSTAKTPSNSRTSAKSVEGEPMRLSGPSLTHVKPSGEAHMVDVGDKPSTKRTAIAISHVGISRETYRQIVENNNKKGDVLGIARIAGIMAAKRTSDIIPLCHPLAISKAEVDVYLVPEMEPRPGPPGHYWAHPWRKGRLVAIQARIECVGPTGVEMEALMAVQGAALTVVDMCKAVEKRLTISDAKVVYKAGGRSGTYYDERWRKHIGEDKFSENGELKEGVDVLLRLPPK